MAAGPRRSDFSFGQQGSAVATVVALGERLLRNTAPDSARKDPWRSRIHSWTESSVWGEVLHKVTQRSVSTEWDSNSLPLSLALPQSPRGQIERLWTPGGVDPMEGSTEGGGPSPGFTTDGLRDLGQVVTQFSPGVCAPRESQAAVSSDSREGP